MGLCCPSQVSWGGQGACRCDGELGPSSSGVPWGQPSFQLPGPARAGTEEERGKMQAGCTGDRF